MEALHTMQPVADYAAPSFVSAIIDNPATAAATAFDANCRDWKEDVGREGDKEKEKRCKFTAIWLQQYTQSHNFQLGDLPTLADLAETIEIQSAYLKSVHWRRFIWLSSSLWNEEGEKERQLIVYDIGEG